MAKMVAGGLTEKHQADKVNFIFYLFLLLTFR
jgi:hypothetical protein